MALTKVRSPVAEIDLIASGTTNVTIASAGGDVQMVVAGVTVLDVTSTTLVLPDAIRLTSKLFTTEAISFATTSGAEMTIQTEALVGTIETTNGFPLELGANGITGLTIATDGKVELDVEGTAVNHLVTKAYIDALTAGVTSEADFVHTQASTGSLEIPTSTGTNLVLNWGKNASVANNSQTVVTFDSPFSNAMFVGFVTPTTSANHDGTMEVFVQGLTSMTIHSSLDKSSAFDWLAIGY